MTLSQFAKVSEVISKEHKEVDVAKVFVPNLIRQLPMSVIQQIYVDIISIIQGQGEFKESLIIDGQLYVMETDLKNVPFGLMSDIHTFEEDDFFKNLHKIMACLFRPAKFNLFKKYKIQPYNGDIEKRADLFLEKMPANVAAGAMVFFLTLAKELG